MFNKIIFKLAAFWLSIFLFFGGCTKSHGGGPTIASILVTPSTLNISVGQTQRFTATAYDTDGHPVSFTPYWLVTNGIGSISTSGDFLATRAGTGKVQATNSSILGEAVVTVTGGGSQINSISVSPTTASLTIGGTKTFTAIAYDSSGNPVSFTPTWSVTGGIGTVTAGGLFTATAAGTGKVRAASGNVIGEATVTVTTTSSVFRFVVMGDSQGASESEPINTTVLTGLVSRITALSPAPKFVLFLGDLTVQGGATQLTQWTDIMDTLTAAGISIYPTIGNHDMDIGYATGQSDFQSAFDLPLNGPSGYSELAYYFEYENSLFVCLDSYFYIPGTTTGILYDNQINSDQLLWLNNTLYTTSKTFKFVFTHIPGYSVGGYTGVGLDKYPSQRDAFWQILDTNEVAIFFAGHQHLYSRWAIDPTVNPSWNNTVIQIISGGAGGSLHPIITDPNPEALLSTYNYVVVDVNNSNLTLTAYDDHGTQIDTHTIIR